MKAILKFFILLIITVVVLSINVNDKPLFSHLYKIIAPVTVPVEKSAKGFLSDSFESTQKVSKQLFDNSVPKVGDKISSKLSAPKGKPQEHIEKHEREKLDDLIKDHSKR